MKVSREILLGYGPSNDLTIAEAQFTNLLDSLRHLDDAIGIDEITDLAEAIADPAKFQLFLEALAEEGAIGNVLSITEEGIAFAPITIPAAAVNAGAGMRRSGEGVTGSDYMLHSTTVMAKLAYVTPEPPVADVVIAHGLDNITTASIASVTANSEPAKGFDWVEIDATNVTIHYTAAPPDDQGDLKYTLITNQIFE